MSDEKEPPMLASELIKVLQALIAEHGDQPVLAYDDYDMDYAPCGLPQMYQEKWHPCLGPAPKVFRF